MIIKDKRKEKLISLFLSIYMFVLFFYPPILPYPHIILALLSSAILIGVYRRNISLYLRISGIQSWLKSMFGFFLYIICVPILISAICGDIVNSDHYITLFNRYFVLIATITPCVLFVIFFQEKYGFGVVIESIIHAGIIEGICSIAAYLNPTIKQMFVGMMSRFSDIYTNNWYITVRAYGFAGTMVDVFGLGIAIISCISFFYGIINKRRYLFFSFVIIISALLNARTGVLLFVVGIVMTAFMLREIDKGSKAPRYIIFVALLIVLAQLIITRVSKNDATSGWIQSGFKSIINFVQTRQFGNESNGVEINKLFRPQYWALPDIGGVLFGTGHSLYRAEGYSHSDVGYINDLWLGGIIGCIILYRPIIHNCIIIFRESKAPMIRFIGIFNITAFLIFNIKAQAIGYNPGSAVIFTTIFVCLYQVRTNKRLINQPQVKE